MQHRCAEASLTPWSHRLVPSPWSHCHSCSVDEIWDDDLAEQMGLQPANNRKKQRNKQRWRWGCVPQPAGEWAARQGGSGALARVTACCVISTPVACLRCRLHAVRALCLGTPIVAAPASHLHRNKAHVRGVKQRDIPAAVSALEHCHLSTLCPSNWPRSSTGRRRTRGA